jgi:phosphoribosylformylglycinamidine synthase subunit PurQ / glutaminase
MKPKVAIIQFPGSNTERETILACQRNGLDPIEFLWNEPLKSLAKFQGYIIVGGFSYQDRSRAGIIAALDPVINQIKIEANQGKPVLGICNGAQILVESGLVPGLENYQVGLSLSENKRVKNNQVVGVGYFNTWAYLKTSSKNDQCVFTGSLKSEEIIHVPLAHGEGRFLLKKELLDELINNNQIAFRYSNKEGDVLEDYPINPNGSTHNIAAICNQNGNVMAIMPHPERTKSGDGIFKSMKEFLNGGSLFKRTLLSKKQKSTEISTYEKKECCLEFIVDMIITDNEALSVENTLNQLGYDVSVSRKSHWEIHLKEKTPEIIKSIEKSGEIYNPNKEFISKINNQKNTVTFLIRQKEDMIGRSKKESLKSRFKIDKILSLKHGVLWKIKVNNGNIESTTSEILKSNILYNPLSYECYRVH